MAEIQLIPNEMLKLIPQFDGDRRQLNLYIRKSEYIIARFRGNENQNQYVMHAVTSRLSGDASALISERNDIDTWNELKTLLIQHFGDPRSEECIAIELESLKIRQGESYGDFCNKIQSVRSNLFSKVNLIEDENMKQSKMIIYNNMALNVFLYNLPEKIVRVVRLHTPETLEGALEIVLEEVNFLDQYNTKNKTNSFSTQKPVASQPNNSYFFSSKPNSVNPNNIFGNRPNLFQGQKLPLKFNYGIPQGQTSTQPQQQFGYRPNFHNPQNFKFGNVPPPQYLRNPPMQLGYRPIGLQPQATMRPQQFGISHQANNQQRYPVPVGYSEDVTMRSAIPRNSRLQGFRVNELELCESDTYHEDDPYYSEIYAENTYPENSDPENNYTQGYLAIETGKENNEADTEPASMNPNPVNFSLIARNNKGK